MSERWEALKTTTAQPYFAVRIHHQMQVGRNEIGGLPKINEVRCVKKPPQTTARTLSLQATLPSLF